MSSDLDHSGDVSDLTFPIVVCDGVGRIFEVRGEQVLALDDVDVELEAGQLIALAGPSGSGKSTLLSILGCIDRPTTGRVRVVDQEVTSLGRKERRYIRRRLVATMVPQPADNLFLARSGIDNMTAAARQRGATGDDLGDLVAAIGIGDFVERACSTMSGGEQQRVALACALIGRTPLVLVDEPTGALDAMSAAAVIESLVRAAGAGATIVTATHDALLVEAATTVVRLDHGRRVE